MQSDNTSVVLPPLYHVSVVVNDIESTIDFLSSVWGLGPWQIMEIELTQNELTVGEPFKIKLAAAKLMPIVLELIQPLEGKSIWSDFLETRGEGLHHMAFSVSNWDKIASLMQEHGGKMVAGGITSGKRRWGYYETSPGGIIVEFEEKSKEGEPLVNPT